MASNIHIFLHILLLMMIKIFYGQLRHYLWSMGTSMRHQRSEKYGWTCCVGVGMECKVWGAEGECFMPKFSFCISLCTLQHTKVKMLTKKFWSVLC